jgi:hypothetical protein
MIRPDLVVGAEVHAEWPRGWSLTGTVTMRDPFALRVQGHLDSWTWTMSPGGRILSSVHTPIIVTVTRCASCAGLGQECPGVGPDGLHMRPGDGYAALARADETIAKYANDPQQAIEATLRAAMNRQAEHVARTLFEPPRHIPRLPGGVEFVPIELHLDHASVRRAEEAMRSDEDESADALRQSMARQVWAERAAADLGWGKAWTPQQPPDPTPTLWATFCTCGERDPARCSPECPVAPRPGVHGGMRPEPVPAKGVRWRATSTPCWWDGICADGTEIWLQPATFAAVGAGVVIDGLDDQVLMAFYRAPEQPEAEPMAVDIDPELETVAGRASREPERWRPCQ